MNLRFRRSLGIFPGLHLNLNKGGVSLTGGVRGAHVTIGKTGVSTSVGIPGTGLSLRDKIPIHMPGTGHSPHKESPIPVPETGPSLREQVPISMRDIIDNKPRFWWVLLLQEGLKLIIEKSTPEWEHATKIGMDVSSFRDWLQHKMDQLKSDVNRLSHIWDVDLPAGLGGNGLPCDEEKICSSLAELAAIVEDLIGWEEEVRGFVDHPLYGDVASSIGGASKRFLDGLTEVKMKLDQQILRLPEGGIDLVMPIHLPDGWTDHAQNAIARLKAASSELREVASERVQVARGDKPLGFFGLRSIQENLEAGIFLDDDWFWSADLNDWRPVKDLRIPFVGAPVVKIPEARSQAAPSPLLQ